MRNSEYLSLHVRNGKPCRRIEEVYVDPIHKIYSISKYIYKRCKIGKWDHDYKAVGYDKDLIYCEYSNTYRFTLNTYNKYTKDHCYNTIGLRIICGISQKSRWLPEHSDTGLWIEFVSHSEKRMVIPFTYDMFDLFKHKYVYPKLGRQIKDGKEFPLRFLMSSFKRSSDLTIEEMEEILYHKKRNKLIELSKEHELEMTTLKSKLSNTSIKL